MSALVDARYFDHLETEASLYDAHVYQTVRPKFPSCTLVLFATGVGAEPIAALTVLPAPPPPPRTTVHSIGPPLWPVEKTARTLLTRVEPALHDNGDAMALAVASSARTPLRFVLTNLTNDAVLRIDLRVDRAFVTSETAAQDSLNRQRVVPPNKTVSVEHDTRFGKSRQICARDHADSWRCAQSRDTARLAELYVNVTASSASPRVVDLLRGGMSAWAGVDTFIRRLHAPPALSLSPYAQRFSYGVPGQRLRMALAVREALGAPNTPPIGTERREARNAMLDAKMVGHAAVRLGDAASPSRTDVCSACGVAAKPTVVVAQCGHLCVCDVCARDVERLRACPLCEQRIVALVSV